MGLLDSNLYSSTQKSGSFTCDLSADGSQNPVAFGSKAFGSMRVVVTDAPTDADFIIVVNGGTVSGATSLKIYDNNGAKYDGITKNGIYYVDLTGITGIYFAVTRRPASGTANIKYAISPLKEFTTIENSILNIDDKIGANAIDSQETLSLATVQNIKTFSGIDTNKYRCLCLYISSLSSGALLNVYLGSGTTNPFYDTEGNIFRKSITKNGIYFIPLTYPIDVVVRNMVAVEGGSVNIRAYWMTDFPKEICNIKPVQKIASVKKDITSSSSFELLGEAKTTEIVNFKFYYVTYELRNNNVNVLRHVVIRAQPYNTFAGHATEILESTNYSEQSAFVEINGSTGIRFFAIVDDFQTGDTIEFHVYGVR